MGVWGGLRLARLQSGVWGAMAGRVVGGLPRPEEQARVHASGPERARVLVVGSGVAAGWGVRSHDLALPGTIARSLAAETGRGVDVEVIASSRLKPRDISAVVEQTDYTCLDAVVVVTGSHAAIGFRSVERWKRDVESMLDELTSLLDERACVLVVGIPFPGWREFP